MLLLVYKAIKNIYYVVFSHITNWLSYCLFKINKTKIGKGFKSYGIPFIDVALGGRILIGDDFIVNNHVHFNPIGRQQRCGFVVSKNAELSIGNNVGISSSFIVCKKKILIGNDVKIGGNVVIYDTDFHSLDYTFRQNALVDTNNTNHCEVIIGNDVFIGAHTTILKGVCVGNKSIIGAGSVVTKSIPPNEIWGGNPAKFIRTIN